MHSKSSAGQKEDLVEERRNKESLTEVNKQWSKGQDWDLPEEGLNEGQNEDLPEISKIHRSRKVPKTITKQLAQARLQKDSADRKQANRIKYDKKGQYKFESAKKKAVVKEID